MLNKEKLEQLLAMLGDLTEEQKTIATEALNGPINEKALFEKLGVDEGKFAEFMNAVTASQEETVLGQELSPDEMEAASGGGKDGCKDMMSTCESYHFRSRSAGCAATVEDGSWCDSNDACVAFAVRYKNMDNCKMANK